MESERQKITNDKIEILERICGKVFYKYLSSGEFRVWAGEFDPSMYCPASYTVGFASYFTTDGRDKDEAIDNAYNKLRDSIEYRISIINHTPDIFD